jgi:hypothetical protein
LFAVSDLLSMPIGKKRQRSDLRLFGGLRRLSIAKAKIFGLDNLPDTGFLLLPNNLTGLDSH